MSLRLLDLPDALREGGVTVNTYQGWESRGSSNWGPILGIIVHCTESSPNSSVSTELRILAIDGTKSAPEVPISQIFLARNGDWWVLASGKGSGVISGTGGPLRGHSDEAVIQIEAGHGETESWTEVQYQSYARGCAALCKHYNLSPDMVVGHKEHQPGLKSDPQGIDMNAFRALVRQYMTGNATTGDDDMGFCAKGERSENVRLLQRRLVRQGVHVGKPDVPAPADNPYKYCDGVYGDWTARAVKEFFGGDGLAYNTAEQWELLKDKEDAKLGGKLDFPITVTGTVQGTVNGSVSGSARPVQ